jgi:uncharacterized membrane protein YraQ (UPF0718 family)
LHLSGNAFGCVVGAASCCFIPLVRPLEAAGAFWRVGFPFWLLTVAGAAEVARSAWLRYRRANVRAGQS